MPIVVRYEDAALGANLAGNIGQYGANQAALSRQDSNARFAAQQQQQLFGNQMQLQQLKDQQDQTAWNRQNAVTEQAIAQHRDNQQLMADLAHGARQRESDITRANTQLELGQMRGDTAQQRETGLNQRQQTGFENRWDMQQSEQEFKDYMAGQNRDWRTATQEDAQAFQQQRQQSQFDFQNNQNNQNRDMQRRAMDQRNQQDQREQEMRQQNMDQRQQNNQYNRELAAKLAAVKQAKAAVDTTLRIMSNPNVPGDYQTEAQKALPALRQRLDQAYEELRGFNGGGRPGPTTQPMMGPPTPMMPMMPAPPTSQPSQLWQPVQPAPPTSQPTSQPSVQQPEIVLTMKGPAVQLPPDTNAARAIYSQLPSGTLFISPADGLIREKP